MVHRRAGETREEHLERSRVANRESRQRKKEKEKREEEERAKKEKRAKEALRVREYRAKKKMKKMKVMTNLTPARAPRSPHPGTPGGALMAPCANRAPPGTPIANMTHTQLETHLDDMNAHGISTGKKTMENLMDFARDVANQNKDITDLNKNIVDQNKDIVDKITFESSRVQGFIEDSAKRVKQKLALRDSEHNLLARSLFTFAENPSSNGSDDVFSSPDEFGDQDEEVEAKKPAAKKPTAKKPATIESPSSNSSDDVFFTPDQFSDEDEEVEAKKPAAKKPTAKKQTAKKPAAKKPAAKKPAAKKPATIKNDLSSPKVKKRTKAQIAAMKKRVAEAAIHAHDAVKKPAAKKPAAKKPATIKNDLSSPKVNKRTKAQIAATKKRVAEAAIHAPDAVKKPTRSSSRNK